ncbi:MAG TPA: hypothetical protein DEO65_09300 [Bacillus bacterium]|nr:hypothetical protein [Bacillus sp. (in: firmicutes)]
MYAVFLNKAVIVSKDQKRNFPEIEYWPPNAKPLKLATKACKNEHNEKTIINLVMIVLIYLISFTSVA